MVTWRKTLLAGTVAAALAVTGATVIAQRAKVRRATEDVGSREVRTLSGLTPGENLLFNGWGIAPAGEHVRLEGDMPLKMAVAPDGKALAAVSCGYGRPGLTLIRLDGGTRETQFHPLERVWNGLAFSR